MTVNTSHTFKASLAKRAVFTILPKFEYIRTTTEGSNISASFNQEIEDVSRSIIENIYTADASYSQHLLNRNLISRFGRKNRLLFDIDGFSLIKLNRNDGRSMLTIGAAANVENQESDNFTYRQLHFPAYPESNQSIMQQNSLSPYNNREYKGYTSFSQSFDFLKSSLKISYDYKRKEYTHSSQFYQDEVSQDYLIPSVLPQFSGNLTPNPSESYHSKQWENLHSFKADFSMTIQVAKSSWWSMKIGVPLAVSQRNLDYRRGPTEQHINRTKLLPEVNGYVGFGTQIAQYRSYSAYAQFSSSVSQPSLLNMVEVVDNTNPMNVVLGNPNLENSRKNTVSLNLIVQGPAPHHSVSLSYTTIRNATSLGHYYLTNTGQSISRPYSVDGNWNANASYRTSWFKMDRFTLTNKISGGYLSSRELIGSVIPSDADFNADMAPPANRVDNFSLSDRFDMSLNFSGKYNFKAFADLGMRKYRSFNSSMKDDLVFNGSYGISGIINLPLNWGLSTDITLFSRRGYADSRLNTTDVLWNARVHKSILKGSLIFSIEGYDLLRQLSNVSYDINAQYRTETVTNVIPAYFLLSIQYRFNKQPKRN